MKTFISQRMAWMNKRKSGGGQVLYQGLCMRAVNQCVGRAIRNRSDSALILFFDGRYARDNIKSQLPDWIQKETQIYSSYNTAKDHIISFCKSLK